MANPGSQALRRISQALSLRPSLRGPFPVTAPQGRPDELMIDWGETPPGSHATLYWPQVPAIDVVRLGSLLYPNNPLTVADAHTVRIAVGARLGFMPIPFGSDPVLAGLFCLDLAEGPERKAGFQVVIRRVRSRPVLAKSVRPVNEVPTSSLRYVAGSFQIAMDGIFSLNQLAQEENTLAILKWRLIHRQTGDIWRPVLERFIADTAARVDALGGKASAIPPSPKGAPDPQADAKTRFFIGLVYDVLFDPLGKFRGITLRTEFGHRHHFTSHDLAIAEIASLAWADTLTVRVETKLGSKQIENIAWLD